MATIFGKYLRKLRIDRDELLKDMADKIGIASSTLSSIESGRRKPSSDFVRKVSEVYKLEGAQLEELESAFMQSLDEISLRIEGLSEKDQQIAVSFARRFENLSEREKQVIEDILNGGDSD